MACCRQAIEHLSRGASFLSVGSKSLTSPKRESVAASVSQMSFADVAHSKASSLGNTSAYDNDTTEPSVSVSTSALGTGTASLYGEASDVDRRRNSP